MIVVFAIGDTIYSVLWYNCTQCGYIYAWVGVTFTQNYVLMIQDINHVQINGKRLQTSRMLHWSKTKLSAFLCMCNYWPTAQTGEAKNLLNKTF